MTETIITSSVLILIILGVRYFLRRKISAQLQYALWVLVAVRLLLPFSLFESPVSVMNVISDIMEHEIGDINTVQSVEFSNEVSPALNSPVLETSKNLSNNTSSMKNTVDMKELATIVWIGGLILFSVFFAISNLRLQRKLRRNSKIIDVWKNTLPIYLVEDMPSPCLFGLIKPNIYITAESLTKEKRLEYVIAHEVTHYYQKDHVWAFIRMLCLCIHWFNPLVWLAVIISRLDCELACDEKTLHRIGRENRAEYGKTLIEMMVTPSKSLDILGCSTITGYKGEMTERIKRIVKQPKTLRITSAIVVVIAVAAVLITFGGVKKKVPIVLPQSNEVTGIIMNRVIHGELQEAMPINQKKVVEQVLKALSQTDMTLRESVNDAPNKKDFFQIDIDGLSTRRFYLYDDGYQYYVEEPYVGIYKTNRETQDTIEKIYSTDIENTINVQELYDARTPYVGDNSAVGKLLNRLPLPNGLLYDHFELRTAKTERGVLWVLKGDDKTLYHPQQFELNALLLFALIDNMEDFYVEIIHSSDNNTSYYYNRAFADGIVKGDVRDYAQSPEQLQELISLAVTSTYSIAKLENGELVYEYPVQDAALMEAIIRNVMVKSAAWEGVDITTLKECYVIRQTLLKTNEVHEYDAYLLEDGSAVLQYGKDGQYGRYGQYSYLSQELYLKLVKTWSNLTMDKDSVRD